MAGRLLAPSMFCPECQAAYLTKHCESKACDLLKCQNRDGCGWHGTADQKRSCRFPPVPGR